MKLYDVTENSKGIDDKILELIDLKIGDDMKQVMTELKSLEKRFDMILWLLDIALSMMIAISVAVMTLK